MQAIQVHHWTVTGGRLYVGIPVLHQPTTGVQQRMLGLLTIQNWDHLAHHLLSHQHDHCGDAL